MPDWLNSITARIVQDLATSGASWLALHGFLTNDQKSGFIGAVFFLLMLLINTILHATRAADNQVKGANQAVNALDNAGALK